jgi:hypothetical protein
MAKRGKRHKPVHHERLVSRLEKQGLLKGRKILYQPEGYEKLSTVVWEFIEPHRKYANTYESLKKLIVLAILAWNASMLPDDEAKDFVDKVVDSQPLSKSDHDMMISVVNDLIKRKKKYFSQYTRDILDYELIETEDEFRLSIVSFLDTDSKSEKS